MMTINSHGVEFTMAGCVVEIVCGPNLMTFFFPFFFFSCALFHSSSRYKDYVQR